MATVALLSAFGLGWLGHAGLVSAHSADGDEMYEEYRAMWWSVAQGFCPDGFRLVGKPDTPLDSHSFAAPVEWYGPSAPYAEGLFYKQDCWRTTQRSLGWVNDEEGYGIVVHMVFTEGDWGRGALAFPVGNSLYGPAPELTPLNLFPPEWHFVGTRDNVVFFFQLLPLREVQVESTSIPPREWITRCCRFIGEFRQFLDGGT